MKYGITAEQKKALAFIANFIKNKGYSPSYDEIAKHMGLKSKNGVYKIIHSLKNRGLVDLIPRAARSIMLIN